jgi:hypothetical protein
VVEEFGLVTGLYTGVAGGEVISCLTGLITTLDVFEEVVTEINNIIFIS